MKTVQTRLVNKDTLLCVLPTGETLLSPSDERLIHSGNNGFGWYINSGYVVGSGPSKPRLRLHRLITRAPSGALVDHINGDTTDNRRSNLRLCNQSENLCNRGSTRAAGSQYKGVSWHKGTGKWQVDLRHEGKTHYVGVFDDETEAARRYDDAARQLRGDFAWLNFPTDDEAGRQACQS